MAGSFENPVREKPVTQHTQTGATSNWLPLAKPLQHFLQHLFRGIRTGHHAVTPYFGAYSLLRHDCYAPRLFGLSCLFSWSGSKNERNQTNQSNQINEKDQRN